MRGGDFEYTPAGPRVVFGTGIAARRLAGELDRLGLRRLLLLATDRERRDRAQLLEAAGGRIAAHTGTIRRHVPSAAIDNAVACARGAEADGLLCIGGGSTTGLAKAVALETALPIIAVPTTYAGSEVTPVHGRTDGRTKRTGRSDLVLPRTVIYDPLLATTLPWHVTAPSAANALAHCFAGFAAPGANPLSASLAAGGLRALETGLRATAAAPADPDARYRLSYGSYLAGTAFAIAGSAMQHTIAHVIGGRYDLPHAETHTALLPHVLRHFQRRHPEAAGEMAAALGTVGATDAADAIGALLRDVGAEIRLRDLGLSAADLPEAGDLLAARIRQPDRSALLDILRDAL
ncbi:maleylacetate reductase [Streptomonospora sediminis]